MPVPHDTWIADMQSRLFWIALMSETLLTKELNLPDSGLQEISDQVPLPRFLKIEQPSFIYVDDVREEDNDSLYHYYFLAQTALRILLTRTSNCLFFTNTEERYSLSSLEEELTHQLEQWRDQLPAPLQFDEDNLAPLPESPKDILVVSWLRARYMSARYHFGRPLL
ncbi:hypothetical protein N7519_003343 [Penicillium mononematosum]|uniref:uncharacterized protein n=1 Tax=Penicillium mononematosum TaxID=268346 RepID=UPI0025476766|nr:uncharacterized protein N7519_003343 [Penicillium mononematosum]KAJ6188435.1 hypothetical protein N7519_003343 [Penicillium mononematosum]